MGITNKKVVRLGFLTDGGKTFTISFDNPRSDMTTEEAEAVMDMIIEKDAILTSSGSLAAIRDIKVVNTTTEDMYDPPQA